MWYAQKLRQTCAVKNMERRLPNASKPVNTQLARACVLPHESTIDGIFLAIFHVPSFEIVTTVLILTQSRALVACGRCVVVSMTSEEWIAGDHLSVCFTVNLHAYCVLRTGPEYYGRCCQFLHGERLIEPADTSTMPYNQICEYGC